MSEALCYTCQGTGHFASDCPVRKRAEKRSIADMISSRSRRPQEDADPGQWLRKRRATSTSILSDFTRFRDGMSPEQVAVFDAVVGGDNVFFTGDAGTGKSFVLQRIVEALQGSSSGGVYVTASTGIAACNIGGTTVHSFAGVGLGTGSPEELANRVRRNRRTCQRWVNCRVLIIDEVSMLDADLFDKLELVARRARGRPEPFGGVQVVLCGDFFQIPPVGLGQSGVKFCFEASSWPSVVKRQVVLRQVFRQRDERLVRTLNQIRHGILTPESTKLLAALQHTDLRREGGIEPTRLFARNMDCDSLNEARLRALDGDAYDFVAQDWAAPGSDGFLKQLQKSCQAPDRLQLKVGTQVILLKNISVDMGLVNGSRGVVVEFKPVQDDPGQPPTILPRVRFSVGDRTVERIIKQEQWTVESGGNVVATRDQLPLKLAWALSIHKCVSEDTLVATAHGLVRISDLAAPCLPVGGSQSIVVPVQGMDRLKVATQVYHSGVEDGVQLRTAHGYVLRGSLRHPVLVCLPEGHLQWRTLPDVQPGDAVVLRIGAQRAPVGVRHPLCDEAMCYLVALCYAAASLEAMGAAVRAVLPAAAAPAVARAVNMLPAQSRTALRVAAFRSSASLALTIADPEVLRAVAAMGLASCACQSCGAWHVQGGAPSGMLSGHAGMQAAFVAGLLDCCMPQTHGRDCCTLQLPAVTRRLAQDVQVLLGSWGIVARRTERPCVGGGHAHATLAVEHAGALRRLHEMCGPWLTHATSARLLAAASCAAARCDVGACGAPTLPVARHVAAGVLEHCRTCRVDAAAPWVQALRRFATSAKPLTTCMARAIASAAGDELRQCAAGAALLAVQEWGAACDRVAEVRHTRRRMFDLHVPEGHDFVADCFLNHNSQGMTIPLLEVSLAGVFECGQAYVALSRATELAGLRVLDFSASAVRAHPKVQEFYQQLETLCGAPGTDMAAATPAAAAAPASGTDAEGAEALVPSAGSQSSATAAAVGRPRPASGGMSHSQWLSSRPRDAPAPPAGSTPPQYTLAAGKAALVPEPAPTSVAHLLGRSDRGRRRAPNKLAPKVTASTAPPRALVAAPAASAVRYPARATAVTVLHPGARPAALPATGAGTRAVADALADELMTGLCAEDLEVDF